MISYPRSKTMATTRVSERGQTVIPKAIRQRAGIRQGQVLDVELEGDAIVMRPRRGRKAKAPRDWREWRGFLKGTDARVDLEREHHEEIRRGR
jgi:AbrB family looped-hinge helix DNA binding protein